MKKIYLILLAAVSVTVPKNNIAQTIPSWSWSKSAGNTNDDAGYDVANDAAGNAYVVGSFKSPTILFGATTLTNTNAGSNDIFVAKYDMSGNVIWAKNFGTANNDEAQAVTIDASGNIYFTGYFNGATISLGTYTIANGGGDDYFTAKADQNGNIIWANGAGGSGTERGQGICVDQSGNINMVGNYYTSFTTGTYTLNNAGNFDICWIKYSPSGTVLFAQGFGSVNRDDGNAITASPLTGNIYISGSFASPTLAFGTTTLVNSSSTGSKDAYIVEINSSNIPSWAERFGGSGDEESRSVKTTPGFIYFSGDYNSAVMTVGTTTLTNTSITGTADVFLSQYNNAHNPVWTRSAGGSGNEFATRIATDSQNYIYSSGIFMSPAITFSSTVLTNAGSGTADIFVAGYDASGNSLWAKSAGSAGDDVNLGLNTNITDNLYITGWFGAPSITFTGTPVLANAGGNDMFVAKLSGTTAGIFDLSLNNKISVYPNPSAGKFNISNLNENVLSLEIYSISGEKVFQLTSGYQNSIIDLSDQPGGIYFMKIKTEKEFFTAKIIIQ